LEVLSDINPDLIFSYRFIKNLSTQDLNWLEDQIWIISKRRTNKLFELKPTTPRERFYRFAYLNKAHYWGRAHQKEGVRLSDIGVQIKLIDRLENIQERLAGVRLLSMDWKKVISKYDRRDTFFYLDPPYPQHWPSETRNLGSEFFTEDEFIPTLKKMKGKFLLSYELEKFKMFRGFRRYRIKTRWLGAKQLGHRNKFELLVSNYPLKKTNLYVNKSWLCESPFNCDEVDELISIDEINEA